MQNHIKVYYAAFGYDLNQVDKIYVPSEISGAPYNDIHHIIGRGKMGEDRIENLMALTRKEHIDYGDEVYLMEMLLKIHQKNLEIPHNPKFFDFYINKYQNLTLLKDGKI